MRLLPRRAPAPPSDRAARPIAISGWPRLDVRHEHVYGPRPRQEKPLAAEVWIENSVGEPVTGRLVMNLGPVGGGRINLRNYPDFRDRVLKNGPYSNDVVVCVAWRH